jgi:hypothetical protein
VVAIASRKWIRQQLLNEAALESQNEDAADADAHDAPDIAMAALFNM